MRVAVIFDNLGPYHLARLTASAELCELVAIQCGRTSAEYAWEVDSAPGFPTITLNEHGPGGVLSLREFRSRLEKALSEASPEVVFVPGWSTREALLAIRWCLKSHIPVVTMSASSQWDDARSGFKEFLKRRIVSLSSAALGAGKPQKEYLLALGIPEDSIFLGYDAVDNDFFSKEAEKWRQAGPTISSSSANAESTIINGEGKSPYFLASARFVEKKNLFRLLEAYARYVNTSSPNQERIPFRPAGYEGPGARHKYAKRMDNRENRDGCLKASKASKAKRGQQQSTPWSLCLLGDGKLKPDLLDHAAKLGLTVKEHAPWEADRNEERRTKNEEPSASPTVFFPGFRQIEELPRFYAHAGAFVHASTAEQWGLVVNEAMACGLPVLVSNHSGCASDLVLEGINGFSFDPENIVQLTSSLTHMAAPDCDLDSFGSASRRIIANWGPKRFAVGLLDAAEKAIATGAKHSRLTDRLLLSGLMLKEMRRSLEGFLNT